MKTVHHHKNHTFLVVVATTAEERKKLRARNFFELRQTAKIPGMIDWYAYAVKLDPGAYIVRNVEDENGKTTDFDMQKLEWHPNDYHARTWNAKIAR